MRLWLPRSRRLVAIAWLTLQRWRLRLGLSHHPFFPALLQFQASIGNEALATKLVSKSLVLPNGARVGYLEYAPASPAKRTIVALHGLTGNPDFIAVSWEALKAPADVRVLIPEAIGHGSRTQDHMADSAPYGFGVTALAADLAHFLAAAGVAEDAPIDLIGYSMGGATALAFAHLHARRLRRVVLLAPAIRVTAACIGEDGRSPFAYETGEEAAAMCRLIGTPEAAAAHVGCVLELNRYEEGPPDGYWQDFFDAITKLEDADETGGRWTRHSLEGAAALGAASVPVMVLQGDRERAIATEGPAAIAAAHAAAAGSSSCTLVTIPDFGHTFGPAGKRCDDAAAEPSPLPQTALCEPRDY